jgi:hypothetical protein
MFARASALAEAAAKTGEEIRRLCATTIRTGGFPCYVNRQRHLRDKGMSDRPEGVVSDAGEAVQGKINQAGDVHDQIVEFIRENPISAVLIAIGIGYVLGKIA